MSYQMIVNELICFPVIYLLSIIVSTVTLHYCEAVMNLCHLILYNEFVLVGSLWWLTVKNIDIQENSSWSAEIIEIAGKKVF